MFFYQMFLSFLVLSFQREISEPLRPIAKKLFMSESIALCNLGPSDKKLRLKHAKFKVF